MIFVSLGRTLNISSSVVELVFEDDFQKSWDSVFVNSF